MAGRNPLAFAIVVALAVGAIFVPAASAEGPAIALSKSGPSYVNQGDSATYTFYAYNAGDSDLTGVVVADDQCSPLSAPAGDDGDGILNPGEGWTYSCSYTPAGSPGDEVVNHATADALAFDEVPVHADAYHSTWITALHVTKTVDKTTADPFDELNYTITVRNDGPAGFSYDGYLSDEGCEDLQSQSENADGPWFWLPAGASVVYTCRHNFNGSDYTNEACALVSVYRDELARASLLAQEYDLDVCDSVTTTPATHAVSGQVFEDMNADGARQGGEPPLSGIVLYADLNGNGVRDEGEPHSTSDGQGNYSLSVELGTTTIREDVPGGFTCSFPSGCAYSVDLPKNSAPVTPDVPSRKTAARADDPTGKDFGDWRPASVTGAVIGDDNGNGARDSGELGLAGIAVFADLDGNGILDQGEPTVNTAADGTYALSGLKPGGYVIRHVLVQDGRTCSAPAGCNHSLALLSNGVAADKDFLDAKAAQVVLGARIVPGVARMTGKTGCVTGKGFYARMRGKKMLRVVFFLDGKAIKSVAQPRDNRTYRARINLAKLAMGQHTVAAKVTFRPDSHTRSKTIRLTFERCARQLHAPQFTG